MSEKVTLKARNTVLLTVKPGSPGDKLKGIAPKPPVVKTIAPNTLFNVSAELAEDLTKGVKPAAERAEVPEPVKVENDGDDTDKKPAPRGRRAAAKKKESDEGTGDADASAADKKKADLV